MSEDKKPLPHEQELIIQFAIEGLIKGYSNSELAIEIKRAFPEVVEEAIDPGIRQALATIREQTLIDVDKIIPQHVELYEKIYMKFDELRYVPGKLKVLRAKEKLLGLLKETNMIEVHNELNIEVEVESEYDLEKLNPQEKVRIAELLAKIVRQ